MNGYAIAAILFAFVAWSGFMYHEGSSRESDACAKVSVKKDLVQANVTVAAQKGVIATVAKQQIATNGVDHDYQIKLNDIDNDYADSFNGLYARPIPAPASPSLPASAAAAIRPVIAAARPFKTKVFKLNPQECDQNTEQLYGLQAWIRAQQAITPPAVPVK